MLPSWFRACDCLPRQPKPAARLKVDRLEKAVEALGDYDGPELAGLKQALKKAREIGPGIAHRRPDHAVQGVHRAQRETPCQNRGGAHRRDEVVGRRSCTVVSSGTRILFPVGNVSDVTMVAPDTEVELARLRVQLAEFQDNVVTERPRVRQRVGGGGPVHPMPTLVPAELSEWMVDRQADLQEATNASHNVQVLTVTSNLSEAQHMCELSGFASSFTRS